MDVTVSTDANAASPFNPISQPSGDRPLRIALLGYRSAPFSGGQGVYLHYLSKALLELGHQVDVISGEPYPKLDPRVKLIKLPGLNLFAHPNPISALKWQHLRSFHLSFEWFSQLTGGFPEPFTFGLRLLEYFQPYLSGDQSFPYDVVHDNQSLCYALLTLQHHGIATLATIHHPITRDRDIALKAAKNWQHRWLIRRWHSFLTMQKRVARRLNAIVTVSQCSKQDIQQAFGVKEEHIHLVYNGIDITAFAPRPHIKPKPYRLMATASADQPLKGLDYLLKALAKLRQKYPHIELYVVGKTRALGHTERLIEQLNLQPHVVFKSNLTVAEICDYYAQATIAVVPSLYEGFGLPAGEAMACGVAVVSTTGGALPEVVGDAGLLVPPADVNALVKAITQLLENPKQRQALADKGRVRIQEVFNWPLCAEQMVRCYQQQIRLVDRSVSD